MPRWFVVVALAVCIAACNRAEERQALDVAAALSGDTAGYARALTPRPFAFPADHGPHPAFKTEWWYYTGNLATPEGDRVGFQFTVFRSAAAPPDSQVPDSGDAGSVWRTRQIYMAHFAVSDGAERRFFVEERFSRGARGLAGAQGDPFRVWLEDWEVRGSDGEAFPTMVLKAHTPDASLQLTLEPLKPVVLQGDRGLSRKGNEPGNASYYYSLTRLRAHGEVLLPRGRFSVQGSAWMDREWSTSVLEEDQVGWDWFALQLGDDTELMVYQLRRENDAPHERSRGVFVNPAGQKTDLLPPAFDIEPTGAWTGPTGARYPSGWSVTVPELQLELNVEPLFPEQELDVSFRYWEGAVRVSGRRGGNTVTGVGYVELTGYDRGGYAP